MANAGAPNGGYGPGKPSPYWNAQSEPEIDVWDPTAASRAYDISNQTTKSTDARWENSPAPPMQQANVGLYNQANIDSNWRNQMNPVNVGAQVSFYDPNAPPDSYLPSSGYSGQTMKALNSFEQYGSQRQTYTPPLQTHGAGNSSLPPQALYSGNPAQTNFYNDQLQSGNWSAPPQNDNYHAYNPNAGTYQQNSSQSINSFSSPSNFKNPLMDKDDKGTDEAVNLIRNMHIQGQKSLQSNIKPPKVLSHASLAALSQDLIEAAAAFQSPEALKLAREKELGFHSVGTTVVVSKLSAEAPSFVPRVSKKELVPQLASSEEETAVVQNLKLLIANVLTQPGNFDNLSAVFINQVKAYLHSDETVKEMVEIIFTKAIKEDNFKYLGARLCDRLTMPKVLVNFRSIFLNRFQDDFKMIKSLLVEHDEKDIAKVHGFIMFMAEIFMHIKVNGAPITSLGRSLSKSLEKLLTNPTYKNISFVCKLLKLAGAKLLDAFKDNENDMENYQKAFSILSEFAEKQKDKTDEENKRINLLISSVTRLKDINWGRTISNTRPKSSIEDPEQYGDDLAEVDQNYYMNEPVFFTPDGVQYTAAEAQIPEFYEQHLAKFKLKPEEATDETVNFPWIPQDNAFDDFVPSDDEVEYYKQDLEIKDYEDEFERFLAESGQV